MSEQVRRWGSIGILSTIGATLLASAIIWLFTMVAEVKPLMVAVERMADSVERIEMSNNKAHNKLIELIERDQIDMTNHDRRIQRVEIMCELAKDKCEKEKK